MCREFYGYMRPREYMSLCGQHRGGWSASRPPRAARNCLPSWGLNGVKHRISGFSTWYEAGALAFAQALLGTPKLLICDEPTSALDPLGPQGDPRYSASRQG